MVVDENGVEFESEEHLEVVTEIREMRAKGISESDILEALIGDIMEEHDRGECTCYE